MNTSFKVIGFDPTRNETRIFSSRDGRSCPLAIGAISYIQYSSLATVFYTYTEEMQMALLWSLASTMRVNGFTEYFLADKSNKNRR